MENIFVKSNDVYNLINSLREKKPNVVFFPKENNFKLENIKYTKINTKTNNTKTNNSKTNNTKTNNTRKLQRRNFSENKKRTQNEMNLEMGKKKKQKRKTIFGQTMIKPNISETNNTK